MSADERQRALQGSGIIGKSIGNRAPALKAQAIEDSITQGSQNMGRIASAHLTGILLEGHIPHILDLILNRPMGAPQSRQRMGLACERERVVTA
jgi:hypothetical protein